jgi:hypothetical protein
MKALHDIGPTKDTYWDEFFDSKKFQEWTTANWDFGAAVANAPVRFPLRRDAVTAAYWAGGTEGTARRDLNFEVGDTDALQRRLVLRIEALYYAGLRPAGFALTVTPEELQALRYIGAVQPDRWTRPYTETFRGVPVFPVAPRNG